MRPPAKWMRVLAALASGRSFNRFEAARELGDHCLHTTVATIQKKGVPVRRRTEKVSGYMGTATECCRYWLEPTDIPLALALLTASRRPLVPPVGPASTSARVLGSP